MIVGVLITVPMREAGGDSEDDVAPIVGDDRCTVKVDAAGVKYPITGMATPLSTV